MLRGQPGCACENDLFTACIDYAKVNKPLPSCFRAREVQAGEWALLLFFKARLPKKRGSSSSGRPSSASLVEPASLYPEKKDSAAATAQAAVREYAVPWAGRLRRRRARGRHVQVVQPARPPSRATHSWTGLLIPSVRIAWPAHCHAYSSCLQLWLDPKRRACS